MGAISFAWCYEGRTYGFVFKEKEILFRERNPYPRKATVILQFFPNIHLFSTIIIQGKGIVKYLAGNVHFRSQYIVVFFQYLEILHKQVLESAVLIIQ